MSKGCITASQNGPYKQNPPTQKMRVQSPRLDLPRAPTLVDRVYGRFMYGGLGFWGSGFRTSWHSGRGRVHRKS